MNKKTTRKVAAVLPSGGESLLPLGLAKKIKFGQACVGVASLITALFISKYAPEYVITWWIATIKTLTCAALLIQNQHHYGKKSWEDIPITEFLQGTIGQSTLYFFGGLGVSVLDRTAITNTIVTKITDGHATVTALVQIRTNLITGHNYRVILGPVTP